MNKISFEERKHRRSLTILCGICIFVMMLVSYGLGALILFVLDNSGVINITGNEIEVGYRFIWWMLLFSVVFGAAASYFITNELLRPINYVINAMNSLASGNFKTRLKTKGLIAKHSTVREFVDSFNTMAQELDGTEMLRSDFINDFSHEFKTPIVSIAGFAKLLKRGNLSEVEKNEYLDIIESESMRLSNMSTNVLNLTRIENQSILKDISKFDLSEQIRACTLMFEDAWSEKNIDLNFELDEYYIEGNQDLLKHVWINLIDNAIKFTPAGGSVYVSGGSNANSVQIVIGNTGSTIPEEALSKIYNKFYQADKSHSTKGFGIGLAVVKQVIDMHDGSIDVKSHDDITEFIVSLPLRQGTPE